MKFFVEAIKMRLNEQMVYKTNFVIQMLTLLSFDLVLPLFTILLYLKTDGFIGWSFYQIILFQGVFLFVNSIDRMFFQRVDWNLGYDVRNGIFDRYLLYPVDVLAYISFTNFGIEHVADMIIGIGFIVFSLLNLGISITFFQIILFVYLIGLALLFMYSLAVIKYSIIVRAIRMGRIGELFRTIKNYGQYPVDIYSSFMSSVFRFVLPLAVIAYYPSKVLLENTFSNVPFITLMIIIFFVLGKMFWIQTLKSYSSAGG